MTLQECSNAICNKSKGISHNELDELLSTFAMSFVEECLPEIMRNMRGMPYTKDFAGGQNFCRSQVLANAREKLGK